MTRLGDLMQREIPHGNVPSHLMRTAGGPQDSGKDAYWQFCLDFLESMFEKIFLSNLIHHVYFQMSLVDNT